MTAVPRSLAPHCWSALQRTGVLALFLAAGLLLSCTVSRSPAPSRPAERERPAVSAAGLERKIHGAVNRERGRQGLAALAWDDRLALIAKKHSKDMAVRGYFDHVSPEGRDFSFRYQQDGYACSIRVGTTRHLGAENILQNNLYDSVTTVNGKAFYDWNSEDKIAETTVRGWMDSPGHRKNILTPHWRNEGIGVHIAPDERIYITQNFC